MRIELLQGAEADLLEAYIQFEERRTGRGDRFYRMLDTALDRLRQHPEMAPIYVGAYRRLVLRPFHFGVFYTSRIAMRYEARDLYPLSLR